MEGCVSSLVLFMNRAESTEEESNNGQVVIARSHVQAGVPCIIFEVSPGAAQQEDACALGVTILAGQVQSRVPCLVSGKHVGSGFNEQLG